MSRGGSSMPVRTFSRTTNSLESTEDSRPKRHCFPLKTNNSRQQSKRTKMPRAPPPETNVGSIRRLTSLGRKESASKLERQESIPASIASGPADLNGSDTGGYASMISTVYGHSSMVKSSYPSMITGGNRNMAITSHGSEATAGRTSVADMSRGLQRLAEEVREGRSDLTILLNKYLCQMRRTPPCSPSPCQIATAASACRPAACEQKVRSSDNEGKADIQPLFRILLGGGGANQSEQSRRKSTVVDEDAGSVHKNGSASGLPNFVEELTKGLQVLIQRVQNDKVALNVMVQRALSTPKCPQPPSSTSCPLSTPPSCKVPSCPNRMLEQLECVSQELEALTKQVQENGTELTCLLRQALNPCQTACPLPKTCCSLTSRASEFPENADGLSCALKCPVHKECPRPCCRPIKPDPSCELEMIGQVVEQLTCEIRAENEALTCLLKQALEREASNCCELPPPPCGPPSPTEAELCELQCSLRQLVTEVQAEQQQLNSMIREALGLPPVCADPCAPPAPPPGPSCAMLSNLQQLKNSLQVISEEFCRRDDGRNTSTAKTLKEVEESIAQLSRELLEPSPPPTPTCQLDASTDANSVLIREIVKLITEAANGGVKKNKKNVASATCGMESASDVLGAVCQIRQCLERMSGLGSTKDKSEEAEKTEDEEGERAGGGKKRADSKEKDSGGGGGGGEGGGSGGNDASKEIKLTFQIMGFPNS
ncbi:unnamed protein product [Schistocephalus solidus]|uniref:Protein kibra n=1 Tax=Schistocephalus solidus TaxID=70667 RepID=A0A183T2F1_SCHSO|nr:unnamed protein product [Schistocephalus solidus]